MSHDRVIMKLLESAPIQQRHHTTNTPDMQAFSTPPSCGVVLIRMYEPLASFRFCYHFPMDQ